jgi:hypothetical protein
MLPVFGIILTLWTGQADDRPAYVREGDRVEQQFRSYRDRLNRFFQSLRGALGQETPPLLAQVQSVPAPPPALVYGYQSLPRIVDDPPEEIPPITTFAYSWPATEAYLAGENVKLDRAEADLRQGSNGGGAARQETILRLIREYRSLVANQSTIDQYIQYNRFWQRSIVQDRERFDQLTRIYDSMKKGEVDVAEAIREVLGQPAVPSFLEVVQTEPDRVVVRVPVYTDIEDEAFLATARKTIEEMWQAADAGVTYALEIQFRSVRASDLYPIEGAPKPGDRIDIRAHAARFPTGGAVLTSGAEYTHSFVGRYIAVGRGDLYKRTLAHEFGHVLGFRDGYIRGYRDLGEQGFEILELTSFFEDIMSAPRQGRVQPAHFKLLLDALRKVAK